MLEQLFKGAEPTPITAEITATVTEPEKQTSSAPTTEDQVLALRKSMATELNRITAIRKACGGRHPEIEAKAITEGWEPMRAELEVLRLDRPKAPAIHSADRSITTNVLEAACMMTARHPDVESQYDEKTLETATRRFRGGIGLQELLLEAAWRTDTPDARSEIIAKYFDLRSMHQSKQASRPLKWLASFRTSPTSSFLMVSLASNAYGETSALFAM